MAFAKVGALTQPLGGTNVLKAQQAASAVADIKDQLQSLDPKELDALIKQAQATNPQLAQMIQHLLNNLPSTQNTMSLGEIDGKSNASRSHGQQQGSSHALAADLKKLIDDIKKKQESATPSDNAAGAQGQSQYRPPMDHYQQHHQTPSQLYPAQ